MTSPGSHPTRCHWHSLSQPGLERELYIFYKVFMSRLQIHHISKSKMPMSGVGIGVDKLDFLGFLSEFIVETQLLSSLKFKCIKIIRNTILSLSIIQISVAASFEMRLESDRLILQIAIEMSLFEKKVLYQFGPSLCLVHRLMFLLCL